MGRGQGYLVKVYTLKRLMRPGDDSVDEAGVQKHADGTDAETHDDQQAIPLDEAEADEANGQTEGDLSHKRRCHDQRQGQGEEDQPHRPHAEAGLEQAHARTRPAFQAPQQRHRALGGTLNVAPGDRAAQEGAGQPRRRHPRRDLNGHEQQQQAADQGDRRRHRQAIWQAEDDDEQGEGTVLQHRDDVADGQAIRLLCREHRENFGRSSSW